MEQVEAHKCGEEGPAGFRLKQIGAWTPVSTKKGLAEDQPLCRCMKN